MKIGGHNFLLICTTGQNTEHCSWNARFFSKAAKKCTNLMKMKNIHFSLESGIQWPLFNRWKSVIYFQTKKCLLADFLPNRCAVVPKFKKNTQTKNYKIVLTLMPTLVTPLQLALLRLLLLCTILWWWGHTQNNFI